MLTQNENKYPSFEKHEPTVLEEKLQRKRQAQAPKQVMEENLTLRNHAYSKPRSK